MNKAVKQRVLRTAAALAGALAFLFMLASCATQTRHELFVLFFDQEELPASTNNAAATQTAVKLVAPTGDVDAVSASVHEPYKDKAACSECHISKMSQKLKTAMPALCYDCHDDLKKGKTVVHAPVDDGSCMACHKPHVSDVKKLLLKPVNALCFECHDKPSMNSIHEPVADGDCSACHVPHSSTNRALLVKLPPSLCFDCHEKKDIEKSKGHEDLVTKACLDCHEVHESAEAKLLKKAAVKK